MRVAFYVRVSTDGQTVENQIRDLELTAAARGWEVVAVHKDEGISGTKGRDRRPAFDQLLQSIEGERVDLVAAWSVDRLGRSMQALIGFLTIIQEHGVELYLHKQNLDTSTPAGRLLFGMLGLIAEFERSLIVDRVKAGLATARAAGKRLGRPQRAPEWIAVVRARGEAGDSAYRIAKDMGVSQRTVWRYIAPHA